MPERRPVLIVGAGPTGLTAALELARLRVPFRIVDRQTESPTTSRALAVQARTLELLQQRRLAHEMVAIGNKAFGTKLYSDGKTLGTIDFRAIGSRFDYILMLPQSDTERVLRDGVEAAGFAIERQTELVAFSQSHDEPYVDVVLRRPDGALEEVAAAYLIAADGSHSTVRAAMDLEFKGQALPHTYALADVHVRGDLPEDELSIFTPESGLLAAFPMGGRRYRIIATEKVGVDANAAPPTMGYMQDAWDRGSHVPVELYDMVWSSRFHINSRVVERLRHRRVFLGGDSAHIHSPAGGQGMNTGIQDMINLCWKIAAVYASGGSDRLLDTYSQERMPLIEKLVATTERATDVFNSDSRAVHRLIEHALPLALSFAAIRRKGSLTISELSGAYRDSPLSLDLGVDSPLRAGDRFPDLDLDRDGKRPALDELDPSSFSIVAAGGDDDASLGDVASASKMCRLIRVASPSERLISALGDADAVVVRPDGYTLCVGRARDVARAFPAWLAQWVGASSDTA